MSNIIIGYHTTSKKNAASIFSSNFKLPVQPEDNSDENANKKYSTYWLGPGVYFFEDLDAAKWLKSENPSSVFGVRCPANSKTIIRAKISTTEDTWDLRTISRIRELNGEFHEYMGAVKQYMVAYSGYSLDETRKRIRCAFFKWLYAKHGIDVIISPFTLDDCRYLDHTVYDTLCCLSIYYSEIQICVYNIDRILEKMEVKEE